MEVRLIELSRRDILTRLFPSYLHFNLTTLRRKSASVVMPISVRIRVGNSAYWLYANRLPRKVRVIAMRVEVNPGYEWEKDTKSVGISHRVLEALALVGQGHGDKEIAKIPGFKYQSVFSHGEGNAVPINKRRDCFPNESSYLLTSLLFASALWLYPEMSRYSWGQPAWRQFPPPVIHPAGAQSC